MTTQSNTRIAPARAPDWNESAQSLLGSSTPAAESNDGHGPPNILYTIAHHPSLLAPFLEFSATIALRGVLDRRDSELLALRAAYNCRSPFEWGHHVEYALDAGMTSEQVEQIANGPTDTRWSARDALLLRAADELHSKQNLSDDTYAALAKELDAAQIVELCFVVGQYTMLSMVANATAVPLEERLPPFPGGN